jgi:hypothetical protein
MQVVRLQDNPEIAKVIRAAFPSYKKRDAWVSVAESVTLSGTYWDGGSRATYVAVDLVTQRSLGAPRYDPPQFGGPRTAPTVALLNGVVIVGGGVSCGKPATAHLWVRPDNVAKVLTLARKDQER